MKLFSQYTKDRLFNMTTAIIATTEYAFIDATEITQSVWGRLFPEISNRSKLATTEQISASGTPLGFLC